MKIVGWSLGYMNPGNLKPRNQKLILLAHRTSGCNEHYNPSYLSCRHSNKLFVAHINPEFPLSSLGRNMLSP